MAPMSEAHLWWAVVFSGIYHGINPGMGWPLAVSAGLMSNKRRSIITALGLLAFGHLLAMILILLPFSLLNIMVAWQKELRIGAGVLVVLMGIYLLINRRHPKFLARVHPARLALWSFLAAMAHGAGLMLVPIFLSINGMESDMAGEHVAHMPMDGKITSVLIIAVLHTVAMAIAGGVLATVIYFWLGLKFLSKTWFNLDVVWALSLVLVGSFGIYGAFATH